MGDEDGEECKIKEDEEMKLLLLRRQQNLSKRNHPHLHIKLFG